MRAEFGGELVWLAVFSAGRPGNVEQMSALLGEPITWYVPGPQVNDYEQAGATAVKPDPGSLSGARNAAIEDGVPQRLTTLMFSDDLKKIQLAIDGTAQDATADEAFGLLLSRFHHPFCDAKLAGCAPTNNAFFSKGNPVSTNLFIVGDCVAVKPECPLRFDEGLPLKEDYDYTCQHLDRYGEVLRCNDILLSFKHYSNAGGAVDVRNDETEQRVIKTLLTRWPQYLQPHATRGPNEISLRNRRSRSTL